MSHLPPDPKLKLTRRQLLKAGAGALALAGLGCGSHGDLALAQGGKLPGGPAGLNPADFTFVHITDTHIEPELGATRGVAKAFAAVNALPQKPAFALIGGDLVMDANHQDKTRADLVYGLWADAAKRLDMPLYHCIGNHDVYGEDQMALGATDPDLGKGMWKRRVGYSNTYNTFDCAGWRFIILDSIQVSPTGDFSGGIDNTQMAWVANLLKKTPSTMPVLFLTHVPIFTTFGDVSGMPMNGMVCENGADFHKMVSPYSNVKAVLQGHTHIIEDQAHGNIRYISGGAVCGNWWKGTWLGRYHEGFGVVTVKNNDISYRYVQYGWTPVYT